ncbi:MAG: ribosomal rRNA E-loop binding protein Ctc/L25/TL5 [Chloroflexi bacterium]|nr:ribosomal rRNA E-loop binding protein Ctc/L25/TL5 [Chloroflexota bacterium]
MTSSRPALAATRRIETGKKNAALRRTGRLPAVVYGHGVESANISIDAHEFDLLRRRFGSNALVELSIDGHKPRTAIVHGIHIHPVSRRAIHVDLYVVKMTEELTVEVPIHGAGESEAVHRMGGTLLHALDRVKVRARPDHLPQVLEADLTVLVDFDHVIKVGDLRVPDGVTILADPDEDVFRVLQPRVVEEEVRPAVAVPAEGEAAAEGEGAEGKAASEG